ncbi:hypothetical protein [Lysobacter sp. ESA13C]|uniref:hypothetical protein n=1 Tax=Lysobacter sp. ESA13C TaxID=2862676 RepID=UPI001CC1B7F9|nr:hypothetical protein [Lysobacter sp. ESA13C]
MSSIEAACRREGRSGVLVDFLRLQATIALRQVRDDSDVSTVAVAVAVAVRSLALAKAIEDPKGGAQGRAPFFIGTGMSRMKKPCVCIDRAGL